MQNMRLKQRIFTGRLVGNKHMQHAIVSDKFAKWYKPLLPELADSVWKQHPHFYLTPRPRYESFPIQTKSRVVLAADADLTRPKLQNNYFLASNATTATTFESLNNTDMVAYLAKMPPMTCSDIMQEPGRLYRLLTFDDIRWYGVVEVKKPEQYIKALLKLAALTESFNKSQLTKITFSPVTNWVQIGQSGRHFFISEFLGETLEQRWRASNENITPSEKKRLIESIRSFINFCNQEGVYWRDLAPRNMFLPSPNHIALIDFEHLYDLNQITPIERLVLNQYRRIWFADMLDTQTIDYLFSQIETPSIDDGELVPADELEALYFKKNTIRIADKLMLLRLTRQFERRHLYENHFVYGHRIGLFLTDFLPTEYELMVYKAIGVLPKSLWPQYIAILERCIDRDQGGLLASYYGRRASTDFTKRFLHHINENANKPKALSSACQELGL